MISDNKAHCNITSKDKGTWQQRCQRPPPLGQSLWLFADRLAQVHTVTLRHHCTQSTNSEGNIERMQWIVIPLTFPFSHRMCMPDSPSFPYYSTLNTTEMFWNKLDSFLPSTYQNNNCTPADMYMKKKVLRAELGASYSITSLLCTCCLSCLVKTLNLFRSLPDEVANALRIAIDDCEIQLGKQHAVNLLI